MATFWFCSYLYYIGLRATHVTPNTYLKLLNSWDL